MAETSAGQSPQQHALSTPGGEAPGLKGVSGSIRLQVADKPAGTLRIAPSGAIEIVADGAAAAVLTVDTQSTLAALLAGEMNPIIAHLQDCTQIEGDVAFALRVLMGLQAGSPWKAAQRSA
jgi:hypothetical protein